VAPEIGISPITIRTAIYVDGFNFYYWLKSTPFRWINIERLALNALAHAVFRHQIVAIKYLTARISTTAQANATSCEQWQRRPAD
jgi:hypothetical protein